MAELIIEAGRTEGQYWRDLWRYRELFYVLAWRDIMVRYKQTAIGVLWAVLQPLLNAIIMTFVFHRVAGIQSVGLAPYILVVYAASMPWQFFSTSLGGSSNSVLSNAQLISKIYFPRLIIPASAVVTALADLGVSLLLLLGMMLFYWFLPTWRICFLPLFVLLGFGVALGPGLLLTALTVKYRDFRHIVPFLIQLGTFASPVGYPSSLVQKNYPQFYMLYCLNPMVGVIDGFRWCILGGQSTLDPRSLVLSVNMTIFLLLLGIWYFRRTERSFADVI
jgi:homopolymeric O-antigen transport system permease protein